jgi:putative phosphoesterase
MKAVRTRRERISHERTTLPLQGDALRVAVVADTHARPHAALAERIGAIAPHHIFHAGDVGNLSVVRDLERLAPVTAVRGNVDARELPDIVTIDVRDARGESTLLKILLTHIAVDGPRLRADVLRLANAEDASLVVCGHSHVPFAGRDRGVTVFNPGSVGPRRFTLPIVLGVIEITAKGVALRHVDCETGQAWKP